MKRFIYHFVCTIVIGFIFYLGVRHQFHLKEETLRTYDLMPLVIFSSTFPVIIGMLFRLPKLILEIKERKQWMIDWMKVISIGVPAIYIAMLPTLAYTPFGMDLPFADEIIFLGDPTMTATAGIVFGYILLDSLKKGSV